VLQSAGRWLVGDGEEGLELGLWFLVDYRGLDFCEAGFSSIDSNSVSLKPSHSSA
jgi:hypothetical protein